MDYKNLRVLLLKRFNIPKEHSIRRVMRSFTIAEKAVFYFFTAVFILTGLFLSWNASSAYLSEVPTRGGTLTEGMVGNPRFINPVLAISEADKNLTALVYSGLVRITASGEIENDLAESIDVSPDRLTYTARIREDARFQDGTQVTADDIIFTIEKLTDPNIKSPKRGNWEGVSVEKVDDSTISFTLKQAYSPFIYNLSTGVLPRHIWRNATDDEFTFSQFNTFPIGSGPYEVDKVERNSGGIPNYYKLVPFNDATGRTPYMENLVFKFYPHEDALIEAYNEHSIDSLGGISPDRIKELETSGAEVFSSPLPRVFAVFFNQSQAPVFLNKEVRQALELASPKKEIIQSVLGGYAYAIDSPLPAGIYPWTDVTESLGTQEERLAQAKEILAKAGWKINEATGILEKKSSSATITLSFTISTGDSPELRATADKLVSEWRKLGAEIQVLVFETGELNQNVIRPRDFNALLFGEVVGRDADLYPFWHSSQRTDPGLNIALYVNSRADKFLDDARKAGNRAEIEENHKAFVEELKKDTPAIFLYTPSFLYVVPEKVKGVSMSSLTVSQDRFLSIKDWYIETDNVWKIFVRN